MCSTSENSLHLSPAASTILRVSCCVGVQRDMCDDMRVRHNVDRRGKVKLVIAMSFVSNPLYMLERGIDTDGDELDITVVFGQVWHDVVVGVAAAVKPEALRTRDSAGVSAQGRTYKRGYLPEKHDEVKLHLTPVRLHTW